MQSTTVKVYENGIVTAPNEELPEYVKLKFNVRDNRYIKVDMTVKENNNWSGKINGKPDINMKEMESVFSSFSLDPNFLDDARTTPKFANNYNRVMKRILKCDVMKSYANGYNFIGDAFINFVTALAVFHKFPDKDTDTLTRYMNIYKNNKYLTAVSIGTGWSKYLDKDTLDYKTLAGSYRGLIGAIYKTNGPERMLDIMEYLNDEIIPESKIKFNKNYSFWDHVMYLSLGFSSGILFSLGMFYLVL